MRYSQAPAKADAYYVFTQEGHYVSQVSKMIYPSTGPHSTPTTLKDKEHFIESAFWADEKAVERSLTGLPARPPTVEGLFESIAMRELSYWDKTRMYGPDTMHTLAGEAKLFLVPVVKALARHCSQSGL